ncbi:MAG: right-handed parallel beta-helix repeat-containing protein [Deltaproteobacteria bacterium]|nr:right-handed parallel beta-helix repeat-containing protein [Deltaproteobacteria bacterium]
MGCGSSSAGADAQAADGSVADQGSRDRGADAREGDSGGPCVKPTSGLAITKDTVLCGGEYKLGEPGGKGVIQLAASGVTLRCRGTVLVGQKKWAKGEPAELGIVINGFKKVTVVGCTARGYRYGLLAIDAEELELRENDFSDNFHDPNAEWVFDAVQGGGVRFERVVGGRVEKNKLARNWNGFELRESEKVTVKDNTVDHCSNTAGLVLKSHHNVIEGNDLSWAYRGKLTWPTAWWGVDTKDSAGLLLDAGSSYNRILKNNLTYGGDGLFLRAVIGACPHHNYAEGNDTSFSPHNAIESWCDDNTYVGNKANKSDYGIWLGGSDRTLVQGNEVNENRYDGFSIQIGESRDTVIDGNVVKKNGRAGMLFTGREYQAWHDLNHWSASLANASGYVIQRNDFAGNGKHDIFLTAIRGVLIVSNTFDGAPRIVEGRDALDVRTLEQGATTQKDPPIVQLAVGEGRVGGELVLDAAGSASLAGGKLSYFWLVQDNRVKFAPAEMPVPLFAGLGQETQVVVPERPGAFGVQLLVDDGSLGAVISSRVYVAPPEDLTEGTAKEWAFTCENKPDCVTSIVDDRTFHVSGSASVHVTTDAPYPFTLRREEPAGHPRRVGRGGLLGFFLRANNPNATWQGMGPVVTLHTLQGKVVLTPGADLLAAAQGEWIFVEVPPSGGPGWKRAGTGARELDVTAVELTVDTYGYLAYDLWLDGFGYY